jgi:protein tyrosine phosphatase (PTP) superfamily phosphohydrolase (DUF442 family)
MDAENTYQVFDWLWTSGQLSRQDIESLPSLGIEAVINLALPTSPNALSGEAELITKQGLNYIHIPVVWDAPDLKQLTTFFEILAALQGRKIWVHCIKNMRVSVFIYLYRTIHLGESEETASYPMNEIWVPNATWQAFIDQALHAS